MRIAQVAAPRPLRANTTKTALRQAIAWAGREVVVMRIRSRSCGVRWQCEAADGVESIRSKRFE
jgi:hypothetical protein